MTAAESPKENGQPEVVGFRVFIGNLSYEVDTEKLKEFFGQAGTIVDAIAVKRFGRSAGYGFVTFETEEAANEAVLLKDTELNGRKVNVERATPRDESAPRRGRGRGRGTRGRGRGTRVRRTPITGEPSKTTLFVGNLPFNVIDQDLYNIFQTFKVESAHVVRQFNGASRGFGFVTLSSDEEQQNALKNLSEVWCDDRKLVIRPALSDEGRKGGDKQQQQHEVVIKSDGTA